MLWQRAMSCNGKQKQAGSGREPYGEKWWESPFQFARNELFRNVLGLLPAGALIATSFLLFGGTSRASCSQATSNTSKRSMQACNNQSKQQQHTMVAVRRRRQ